MNKKFRAKERTEAARRALILKRREYREDRTIKLFDFIETHPGETAYSLSKKTHLPLGTVQSLLGDLKGLIKYQDVVEKGVKKRRVCIMGLADDTWD